MATDGSVRRLSVAQREMLVEHVDRHVPVDNRPGPRIVQVRTWLVTSGLLKGYPAGAPRPTHTALTDEGRAAVGFILGQYADTLMRTGLLERPLDVARYLKKAQGAANIAAVEQSLVQLSARGRGQR